MGKNINIILNKKDIVDKFTISKSTIYIIFAILCVLYIWHLGYYPLFNPDEGRYAEIPREMLFSGNLVWNILKSQLCNIGLRQYLCLFLVKMNLQ